MRRITVSPSPPDRHSGLDLHSWSKGDSFRDEAEVEAALSTLDNELDQTEDALTEWSISILADRSRAICHFCRFFTH